MDCGAAIASEHYLYITTCGGGVMDWKHLLAYITGTVDQELLLRNEYLVTENRGIFARPQK